MIPDWRKAFYKWGGKPGDSDKASIEQGAFEAGWEAATKRTAKVAEEASKWKEWSGLLEQDRTALKKRVRVLEKGLQEAVNSLEIFIPNFPSTKHFKSLLKKNKPCSECGGRGGFEGHPKTKCPSCGKRS